MSALTDLVSDFVEELSAAIEADVTARVRTNIESVFGGNGRRSAVRVTALGMGRPRKKPPIQLCPVPGCKNRAAPVFGMVCSDHKDLSKKKIREYREARREAKSGRPAKRSPATKPARATAKPRKAKRKVSPLKRASRPVRKRAPAPRKVIAAAASAPAAPSPAPAVA
jgi:hypothetical protein